MTRENFLRSIQNVLKHGVENAVSGEYLCAYYGIEDRALRSFLHYARTNGVPVLSSTKHGGYYLPKDQQEAQEFIKAQSNRAKACFASVKAAKEYVKAIENCDQISLDAEKVSQCANNACI